MATILSKKDSATHEDIKKHLLKCNFSPSLKEYLDDLDEYIDKILSFAVRFERWEEDSLVGFLACYANDYETKNAFITMVSVIPEYGGQGLATSLIKDAIMLCKNIDFTNLLLDVNANNMGAIKLYKRMGFMTIKKDKMTNKMSLGLG